jgi:hypothetical protein
MSSDINADFSRLQGTAEIGVTGFNAAGTHPLFAAAHSFALAHRYGHTDPYTYMRNPGLRALDTRQAAMEGMQKLGEGVRRWSDYYRPSIPGPVGPIPATNTSTPTMPSPAKFTKRTYSQRMSPPGMVP